MTALPDEFARPAQPPAFSAQDLARLYRAVKQRRGLVLGVLLVWGVLGGVYYLTRVRLYESNASIMVLQVGEHNATSVLTGIRGANDYMATYEALFRSDVIIRDTLKQLSREHLVDFQSEPKSTWPMLFRKRLHASTIRNTNIVEIAYRSRDPEAAAASVRALMSSYLAFVERTHKSTSREILEVLSQEKTQLEEQLRQKENEVLHARRSAGELVIRDADSGLNVVVERALNLNQRLVEAQNQRLEAQANLVAIESAVRRGEDLQQYVTKTLDLVGREFMLQELGLSQTDAYSLARIQEQLVQDHAAYKTARQFYGPNHPKIHDLQQRIATAEEFLSGRQKLLDGELRAVRDRELGPLLLRVARQKLQVAQQHEQAIRASFEEEKRRAMNLDGNMARLEVLSLELKRLRNFHDVLLERIKNIDLGTEQDGLRTAVLSYPEVPDRPVWPKLPMVGGICLAGGLLCGLLLVLLLDSLDDRYRAPEELRSDLGIPVLSVVRRLVHCDGIGLAGLEAHAAPNSTESEPFRTLRTALQFSELPTQRLVFSSPEPGDGKSTVIGNLAVTFAQAGRRTLLIDADLRRPGLTRLLDLRRVAGLTELLQGDGPLEGSASELIRNTEEENLDFLPCGLRPSNPSELLSGQRFAELLAWAEAHYDQVLVDCGPVLAVTDAALVGRQIDGVCVVVRPDKTARKRIRRAVENFRQFGVAVVGLVVNLVESRTADDYYDYGYGYGYGSEADGDAAEPATPQPIDAEDAAGDGPPPRHVLREVA